MALLLDCLFILSGKTKDAWRREKTNPKYLFAPQKIIVYQMVQKCKLQISHYLRERGATDMLFCKMTIHCRIPIMSDDKAFLAVNVHGVRPFDS